MRPCNGVNAAYICPAGAARHWRRSPEADVCRYPHGRCIAFDTTPEAVQVTCNHTELSVVVVVVVVVMTMAMMEAIKARRRCHARRTDRFGRSGRPAHRNIDLAF